MFIYIILGFIGLCIVSYLLWCVAELAQGVESIITHCTDKPHRSDKTKYNPVREGKSSLEL